tara:strand:- start:15971 stop:16471 length:501 start_codon:yes stop_codon:yes gene_type:complete
MTVRFARPYRAGLLAAFAIVAVQQAAAMQESPSQPPPSQEAIDTVDRDKAARTLCRAMIDSVRPLPTDAGTADLEAALIFVISQDAVVRAETDKTLLFQLIESALSCTVSGAASYKNLEQAAQNVLQSYRVGTGSIRTSNGAGAVGFSPLLGVGGGGGGANYSSNQ